MVKIITSLFLVISLWGCRTAKILTPRVNNLTNTINLQGYYYYEVKDSLNKDRVLIYFLYSNGVLLFCGSVEKKDFGQMEKYINHEFLSKYVFSNDISAWGVYKIDGNEILKEQWYPFDFAAGVPTYISKGEIMNDTTFVLKKISRPNGKDLTLINETYHFRQFSPKPDSTNNFIN